MSAPNKSDKDRELELFEDALVESILSADGDEMREAVLAAGGDPATVVRRFDAMLVAVKAACGLERLKTARQELEAFAASEQPLADSERQAARASLAEARATVSEMPKNLLMAARKGQGASERDLSSLADDLAELERLEREPGADP